MTEPEIEVRHLLNAQTGKIEWPELQRHFARGLLISVASDLDLVEIAAAMVADDKAAIESLTQSGKVARTNDREAKKWEIHRPLFWSVVVPPWVLVQEIKGV